MAIESGKTNFAEVSVKGVIHKVPAAKIDGLTIIAAGSWLKMASIQSEDWWPGEVEDPAALIGKLREQRLKADIFTFSQKLPHTEPRFKYPMIWDNVAAIPITTFEDWWEKRLSQDTRRNVRLAAKRGLEVQAVTFSDELVRGLSEIYNETPFRNGRRFWHYGKDIETIKRENSTYSDRSEFIAAHCGSELVGFFKMVYVNNVASIMQILSKDKHQDKRPMNAMIAKAMEICCAKGVSHLMYRKYVYGKNQQGSLTEFKRRNGFEQILLPKYFIPFTAKGKLAMRLNLHLGIKEVLPTGLTSFLLNLRKKRYERLRQPSKAANHPVAV
jgi:hypothetical protein